MNIYSVVEFIEDHSLEAVPTNWIKKDICAWPITKNFSTIRKLIERKCVPNKIEFIYFKAKVLKTTDSLLKAREMTKKGLIKTDISSAEDYDLRSKRKYKAKKLNVESDSLCPTYSASESENSDSENTTIYNKSSEGRKLLNGWSPSPKKILKSTPVSQNVEIADYSYEKKIIDTGHKKTSVFRKLLYTDLIKYYNFEKEVLHRLAFIKHELRRVINSQMDLCQRFESFETRFDGVSYTSGINQISPLNNVIYCPLPIDNITDLETFNDKIAGDSTFQINLTNQLSYIGGKHTKAMIKRIMNKLFADDLLKHYSYSGSKGKAKFGNLAVCSVIFDAVKQQPKFKNVSQCEMEEVIKYVLAQASFNIKRLEK